MKIIMRTMLFKHGLDVSASFGLHENPSQAV